MHYYVILYIYKKCRIFVCVRFAPGAAENPRRLVEARIKKRGKI